MFNLFKKPFSAIVIFVIIAGGFFAWRFFAGNKTPKYEFIVVQMRDLVQEVSVTGRVKPLNSVDLAFERSGKIIKVSAKVGQNVANNASLVVLDGSELSSQLKEAEANVKIQQAKLDELKLGARLEEIQVQETKITNAKVALEDADKNLTDKLQDAFTKADDAVRNKVDQFFTNPRSASPQIFQYLNIDFQLKKSLEQKRREAEVILNNWENSLSETLPSLNQIKSFLDEASLAVNSATANSYLSQTTLDSWKTDAASARTNINAAINNITLAEEKRAKAESDLALLNQELILKKASSTPEQISGQEAQLEQVRAKVENLQIQIGKTILRAPIGGVITRQDAKVGEVVLANDSIVSLASNAQFEIEADVPEADIAKIKVGDLTDVTLDAYGLDRVFKAKIISIDPAEIIIEGVATYRIKARFLQEELVMSGMTANLDITGNKKEGVLTIPQRVLISKNGGKFVNVLENKEIKEIKVITGFKGSDGFVEIIDGLKEGDRVVVSDLK